MKTINYTNTQNKFSQFVWKFIKVAGIPFCAFFLSVGILTTAQTYERNKHVAYYNAFFTPPTTATQKAKNYEIRYNFAQKFSNHFSADEQSLIKNGILKGGLKERVLKFIKGKHIEHIVASKKCTYYDAFFKTPTSKDQEEQFLKARLALINTFENAFTEEEKELVATGDLDDHLCDKVFNLIQNKFVELP